MDLRPVLATVERMDTPFFLADPTALEAAIRGAEEAGRAWNGPFRVAYSLKTNSLPCLLGRVESQGCWVEVVSPLEFDQALGAGFCLDRIVFNGPLKAKGMSDHQLGARVINIDTVHEAEVLAASKSPRDPIRVGLRVCPHQTAPSWSRFGLHVGAGEFDEALAIVRRNPHLKLVGLHAHLGTQVDGAQPYAQLADYLAPLWERAELGDEAILDVGGGFQYDHARKGPADSIHLAVEAIAHAWRSTSRPTLVVEPGRVIAAPYLTQVARVIAVKRRPNEPTIVVLDTGTNHNISAAFFQHLVSFWPPPPEPGPIRLVGPLCMEDDIMSGRLDLGVPTVGSICTIENAGAYSVAFQRRFIQDVAPVLSLDGLQGEADRRDSPQAGKARGVAPSGQRAGRE